MDDSHEPNEGLVAVFVAPDETTANIVQGLLESEGIDAMVQPRRTTWAGQAALIGNVPSDGVWGDVLVFEKDAPRSRKLIKAYRPRQQTVADQRPSWSRRYSATSIRGAWLVCGFFTVVEAGAVWRGDEISRLVWTCAATLALLVYGFIVMRWQRFVPDRFRAANQLVAMGLLAGALSAAIFAGELGALYIPDEVVLSICILVLTVSIYGAARKYPRSTQQNQEARDD